MCDGCRSLNDMPANKCYKCRSPRPANPTLLDDQYGQVGGAQARVGISVDRSRVAELAARDPVESQKGGGVVDAFAAQDDEPVESARAVGGAKPVPPPIREPVKRGISEIGGQDWRSGLPTVVNLPGSPAPGDATESGVAPSAGPPGPGMPRPARPPGPGIPPGPAMPAAGVALPPGASPPMVSPPTRPTAPTPASMPRPGTFPPPIPGAPMPPPAAPPPPAGMLAPPPGSLRPPPAAPPRGGSWPPPPPAMPPPGFSQPPSSVPQPAPGPPRPPGSEGETTPG